MSTIQAVKAVKRGAAWLDAKNPGWAGSVDVDRLDMASAEDCILGQVYAGEGACCGWCYAETVVSNDATDDMDPYEYGFNRSNYYWDSPTFDELRDAWIVEIQARMA